MKHNESGIPSSNKPTTLVVGYKEDVIKHTKKKKGHNFERPKIIN
ncbi:MAG: hypothetical protein WC613_00645 [Candidatus Aenigmatarchaeota archaeon]